MPQSSHASSMTFGRRSTCIIVVMFLILISGFLFLSVRQESQTYDEAYHLFAGFEYWKHADFGRNPEHPPLVKLLAAVPVLPLHLHEPPPVAPSLFKIQDFLNGSHFLYAANADNILIRGRMVVALFSIMLAILIFLAAREIFNPSIAILALGLFVFEPVILANGALVTTDMPLTCLFFAAVYSFYRYIRNRSVSRLLLCAVATALTIVAKHSGILILPTLLLLALSELFTAPPQAKLGFNSTTQDRHRVREFALAFAAILLVSYTFLWAVYCFRYAARPGQLQMNPTLAVYTTGLSSPLKRSIITFFATHHLFPEAYLYGWVDILRIPGMRSTFVFGRIFPSGRWFFFPAFFIIKSTLTLLIFLLLVPFARIHKRRREFLFLTIPVIFFVIVAISSMLNLGVRHILPIYPFCILLAAAAASSFAMRLPVTKFVVGALLLLTVFSSLHTFPNYLAYSNELAGGSSRTFLDVSDSNVDWGQGLKWTKTYLDQHPASNCWFDYSNPSVDPAYYGINCKPLLSGINHTIGMGPDPIPATISGTVLISATELVGLKWGPDVLNPYQVFLERQPDAIIGQTILVYRGTFDVHLLAAQTNALAATKLLRLQRTSEALAFSQRAVQQAPDSAEVNGLLGQTLLAANRVTDGQQYIASAIHLAQIIHPEFQKSLLEKLQHLKIVKN